MRHMDASPRILLKLHFAIRQHRSAERRACFALVYGTSCACPHSLHVSYPDGNCGLDVQEARRVHLPCEYGTCTLALLCRRVAPDDSASFDNYFLHCRYTRARDCWHPREFVARRGGLCGRGEGRNGSRP